MSAKPILYLSLGLLFFQSCISSRTWNKEGGEYLLHGQKVEGNEEISAESLSPLFRQKPNRRLGPLLPYLWAYDCGKTLFKPQKVQAKIQRIRDKYAKKVNKAELKGKTKRVERIEGKRDKKLEKAILTLKEGNWLMRAVGEKPVFYDPVLGQETADEIKQYLATRGFFQSQVKISLDTVYKKRINVTYEIQENEATYLGDIVYESSSENIDSILAQHQEKSFLKTGDFYTEANFSRERRRIENLLENNGYLYFSNQYVVFRVDTLHFSKNDSLNYFTSPEADSLAQTSPETGQRKAQVKVIINDPKNDRHQSYKMARVFFHVVSSRQKKNPSDTLESPKTEVKYVYDSKKLDYSYKIIDQRIRIRPNQLYQVDKTQETQRSLGILDMFKFVNINPDTSGGQLAMHIYTTPLERYQLSTEVGLNVVQGLPGPFVNFSLKNRNIFGGAEIFENSFRLAIDGQASFSDDNSFYSSQEIGLNSSLKFPKILFPLSRKLRDRLNVVNPTTRLSLGFNFVNRPEYTRTNIAASISYRGQKRFSTYDITLAELNVVNTRDISTSFDSLLTELSNNGNPIIESFDRALVSSTYFIYTYNTNQGNERKPSVFIRFLVEGGGLTQELLRGSSLIEENRIFGLRVFQYWRFNPTFHYYLPLRKPNHSLAFRVNAGIASPFSQSTTLPYEKFFFVGGSSSIRAWQPRRLGPGAAPPEIDEDGEFDYRFERPGEIVLEGNVEYRFPVVSFIRGAVFLDVGNVWTIDADSTQLGGQFRFNSFLEQMAIGTGFGLRFNLPFLLLRLDLGIKAYNPARPAGERWEIRRFNPFHPFRRDQTLINIAIGYPF